MSSTANSTLTVDGLGSAFSSASVSAVAGSNRTLAVNVTNGGLLRATTGDLPLRVLLLVPGAANTAKLNIGGTGSLADLAGGLLAATSSNTTAFVTISGGGGLHTAGASIFGAPNGNTATINKPYVTITGTGSNWTSTNSLSMTNGSFTLDQGGRASFSNAIFGSSTIAGRPATLIVSGTGSRLAATAGDLVLGSGGTGTGTLTVRDGSSVTVAGSLALGDVSAASGVLNIGGAEGSAAAGAGTIDTASITTSVASRINFNHVNVAYRLDALISGAGVLNQLSGTTILTGNNSYAGATTITGGTLRINGNQSGATGLVSVGSGATLGGSGAIGGSVTVANGGALAPGNSPGTLIIAGDLTLSSGSILNYELGQANIAGGALNDLVDVGGNLTLDGTLNVATSVSGSFGPGVYRLFNYSGTLTDNGLDLGMMPVGSIVSLQTGVAGQVNLLNTGDVAFSFWDGGAEPKLNHLIDGGSGVWHLGGADYNWTDPTGTANAPFADGTVALFVSGTGTVTVDNSGGQVTASGLQFASSGYVIQGEPIVLTGTSATIRVGDGSAAGANMVATVNAALSGGAELVKTDAGTLILGGSNSYSGGTRVAGGTLQISSDDNLGAASGGLGFDGGTLSTTATLTSGRSIAINGPGTITTGSATTLSLTGPLSGSASLTKSGAGTLRLNGSNAAYTGDIAIDAGTLAMIGTLGGTVTVKNGSRFEGTGQAAMINNSGTVAPGGNGIGTLTAGGDYHGAGGILAIDAILGGDNSPADRLDVTGSTTGNTQVLVTNRGGLGDQTSNGIKIIDVAGASNGTFTLTGDYLFEGRPAVIAGAYSYRLYNGNVSNPNDGGWYLRSSLLDPPSLPNMPTIPLYQPGVPIYEAYGQTLLSLVDLGTMQERVGNRQWAQKQNGAVSGIWGRIVGKRSRANAVTSTSLSDVDVDSWSAELGTDRTFIAGDNGTRLVGGITGGYSKAHAGIRSPFGNGTIKSAAYSLGATLSWFGPRGFYVDGRVQTSWFDSKLKSSLLGSLADGNKGAGQAYSAEVGKRVPVAGNLSVTPQLQTKYSRVHFNRFRDAYKTPISTGRDDSLETRWGFSLDRTNDHSHIYGVVNLRYEWLNGTSANVAGTIVGRSNKRLWSELGFGGSVVLGERLTLFGEASGNTAIRDFGDSNDLKGTIGLRLSF